MLFCFADDAQQKTPTREGMRPLAGVGGVFLPSPAIGAAQRRIDALCEDAGFPGGELWMKTNLVEEDRREFFLEVLSDLQGHDASVVVVAGGHGCQSGHCGR